MSKVRQTSCRHCRQDIENFSPYRRGEWRDRGNNTHCPDRSRRIHKPVRLRDVDPSSKSNRINF